MKTYVIAIAVIKYKNKYLIGKRAATKKFAPNKWEFISGFVDTKETAEEIILRELMEETGLNGKILKSGNPFVFEDDEGRWINVPFLIESGSDKFTINKKDHSEMKWVSLKELEQYPDLTEIKELKERKLF